MNRLAATICRRLLGALLLAVAPSLTAAEGAAPPPPGSATAAPGTTVATTDALAVFAHPVNPATPDAAFAAVGKRLADYAVIRADYRQEKRIKALTRPLISTGRFVYARERGLYWVTTKPFPGVMILTPTAIAQRLDDGSYSVMRAKDQPMIQAFSDMLLSTFSGDPTRLATHFAIFFRTTDTGWELGLKPHDPQIARAINYLRLEGADYATRVNIVEINGDTTTIDLLQPTSEPPTLTPGEVSDFAHP